MWQRVSGLFAKVAETQRLTLLAVAGGRGDGALTYLARAIDETDQLRRAVEELDEHIRTSEECEMP